MNKKQKSEQDLLDLYAHHSFEDKKDNLRQIQAKLGIQRSTPLHQRIRKKANRCLALSSISALFAVCIFGAYRWILISGLSQGFNISSNDTPSFFNQIQAPFVVHTIFIVILACISVAFVLLILGIYFRKKAKKK